MLAVDETGDDFAPHRLDDPELLQYPELLANRFPAAAGGLGDRVPGWEALPGAIAVKAPQKRPEHVQAFALQQPAMLAFRSRAAIQGLGEEQQLGNEIAVEP